MIESVQLEGLAIGPVTVGGSVGPVQIAPTGGRVLAVFSLYGWGADDEEVGHRVLRAMESIGSAVGDDRISAREAADVLALLDPRLGSRLDVLLELADRVFEAVSDDGRISRSEGFQLVLALASSVLRRV